MVSHCPSLHREAVDAGRVAADHHLLAARDARGAHAARHHRRVRGHAAGGGEDALGGVHAADVLGRGLAAHQQHALALLHPLFGGLGREHHLPGSRARRGVEPGGKHRGRRARLRPDHRVQALVEQIGGHPADRLLLRDEPLAHHVDGQLDGRRSGALAVARLQQEQAPLLDGELHVLHVAVVRLQPPAHFLQLRHHLRCGIAQLAQRQWRADAGHHVLALGVDQVLAVEGVLAGGGIAGKADAGAGVVAEVAEHHRLHVHGGAEQALDALYLPVADRSRAVPGAEYRVDGAPELIERRLRKRAAGVAGVDFLVGGDHAIQVVGVQVGVLGHSPAFLGGIEGMLEMLVFHPHHHVAVHLDEAPVGVLGEARVARLLGQPLDRGVVEPKVEHRVHHAGHRLRGAGAHAHQQRIAGVAQLLAHHRLQPVEVLGDLFPEPGGVVALVLVERGAHLGGDGEPGRHRDSQVGHLGQVGALAAEQLLHLCLAFGAAAAEEVDVLGRGLLFGHLVTSLWSCQVRGGDVVERAVRACHVPRNLRKRLHRVNATSAGAEAALEVGEQGTDLFGGQLLLVRGAVHQVRGDLLQEA